MGGGVRLAVGGGGYMVVMGEGNIADRGGGDMLGGVRSILLI